MTQRHASLMSCNSFLFSIIILLLLPCLAIGQTVQEEYLQEKIEVREFDSDKWKSLSEDIDYSGEGRDEVEQQGSGEGEPEITRRGSGSGGSSGLSGGSGIGEVFKYLIIGVAILAVIFILVKLLADDGPKDKKIDPVSAMELEEIEENLEQAELDDPIRRAIASGNYTLAVRLYYLALLQELSGKRLIRWKRDKTNGEYLRELSGSPLSDSFRDVTLIFERVWYGKVELVATDFSLLETHFKTAIASVQQQAAE